MKKQDLPLTSKEKEILQAMEDLSQASPEQLKHLKDDEEATRSCRDIADLTIAMLTEKNPFGIDTDKELAKFHENRHNSYKKKATRILAIGLSGIAAAIIFFLILRPTTQIVHPPLPESVYSFRKDNSEQRVTLQVNDKKKKALLTLNEVSRELPPSVVKATSPKEINYFNRTRTDSDKTIQIHKLSIPRGEIFKVTLSDGTEAILNADSRLTYPTAFTGKERVVSLEGEAYFKVAKDSARPFVVKSGNMQVRVLGTEFNVRSYSPEETDVTLISGKVLVSDSDETQTAEIRPEQRARLTANHQFDIKEVDIEPLLYWKEGFFYFDDITLADMMEEIGRWYNIDIEFRNRDIMSLRMHFSAERRKKLTKLVELLNRTGRIHCHLEPDKLIIE